MPANKKSVHPNGEHVWALLVVSSDVQSDTIPHQRKWAEDTAKSKGWRVTRFVEGVSSGKDGLRKHVTGLISDLRGLEAAERPKWLLMIRLDRLGRGDDLEGQIALRDLRKLGVSVWTRDQGPVKIDNAMDGLINAATFAVARHENEVRRDKMLNVYKRKRDAGERVGNRLPYGLIDKDGKDVPDGDRAEMVKLAFKMRLEGYGFHLIGKRLTALAPPQVFKKSKRGEVVIRWTPTRISRLLSNRAYIGPIVDEGTFARAQGITASLAAPDRSGDKRRRFPWPLSGTLKCHCGKAMTGMACGEADRRIRYYACRLHDGKTHANRLVRADHLEAQFVQLLANIQMHPEDLERFESAPAVDDASLARALADATKNLREIERKRDVVWDLHSDGKVKDDDVQVRLDKLSEEARRIKDQIGQLQQQVALSKSRSTQKRDLRDAFFVAALRWRDANVEEQKTYARRIAVMCGGFTVEADGTLNPRGIGVGPAASGPYLRTDKKQVVIIPELEKAIEKARRRFAGFDGSKPLTEAQAAAVLKSHKELGELGYFLQTYISDLERMAGVKKKKKP